MGVTVDPLTHSAIIANIGSDTVTVVKRRPPP